MPRSLQHRDQLFLEFLGSSRIAGMHDKISQPRRGPAQRETCAPVAIRGREVANRLAAQQKVHQYALLHQRNALCLYALIVHLVVTEQRCACQLGQGRIVHQAQKFRQHARLVATGKLPAHSGVLPKLRFVSQQVLADESRENRRSRIR